MPRFTVLSDLHLEFGDICLPGGDVLMLSGDIAEAKNIRKDRYDPRGILFEFENRRPDRFYRFFAEECSKYQHVFYVMGNHEFYGSTFHKVPRHIRDNVPNNVTLLNRDSVELGDVTIVGVTLWTDLNRGDPMTELHLESCMNDYRHITMLNEQNGAYHRLRARKTYQEHQRDLAFIDAATADPSRRYVVMGHHAPSKLSIKPKYANDRLTNGGYSSDLDEFILDRPQIKVWTHGHTHTQFDYMIGQTRVLCNPRGYAGYEETAVNYDVNFGFDL